MDKNTHAQKRACRIAKTNSYIFSSSWFSLYTYRHIWAFTHDELLLTLTSLSISTEIVIAVNVNYRVHTPRTTRDRRTALLCLFIDSERGSQPFYLSEKNICAWPLSGHLYINDKDNWYNYMTSWNWTLSVYLSECLLQSSLQFLCLTSKCSGAKHGYKCSFHTSWVKPYPKHPVYPRLMLPPSGGGFFLLLFFSFTKLGK